MKPTLLFIDPCDTRGYDPSNVHLPGIGGTERTVTTLAERISETGLFKVIVEQLSRKDDEADHQAGALYTRWGECTAADRVIVLRDASILPTVEGRFPNAKGFLWTHDVAGERFGRDLKAGVFGKAGMWTIICVSSWHKGQTRGVLGQFGYNGRPKIEVILNPLEDYIVRTHTEYDRNKLIWLASPHKGLRQAYDIFEEIVRREPEMRLYVTNPGYCADMKPRDTIKDKVVVLGTLTHPEMVEHLRTSLCLFNPNMVFPETFCKVAAEANMVGTPVLYHPLGATSEVLDLHPSQCMDCSNVDAVAERVLSWRNGNRPVVRGKRQFRLNTVVAHWMETLCNV